MAEDELGLEDLMDTQEKNETAGAPLRPRRQAVGSLGVLEMLLTRMDQVAAGMGALSAGMDSLSEAINSLVEIAGGLADGIAGAEVRPAGPDTYPVDTPAQLMGISEPIEEEDTLESLGIIAPAPEEPQAVRRPRGRPRKQQAEQPELPLDEQPTRQTLEDLLPGLTAAQPVGASAPAITNNTDDIEDEFADLLKGL